MNFKLLAKRSLIQPSRDLIINEVMVSALIHSHHSQASQKSGRSYDLDDESRDKGLCPIPECGRVFKDLKAHMLTHQNERPEKCPIATCEYHLKGNMAKTDTLLPTTRVLWYAGSVQAQDPQRKRASTVPTSSSAI
ncbi:uncharacterized protein K441DRAFT_272009 [Cenococcum geophilum 1.58]|uniref:uncharacterized protein n=1 Tax=Cenococcum geophilum 1.58 TaxID=794803 RepID=UPI00358E4A7E|nr:hypothetical protein K441DRAFT_272009 [Cenococcum geophilum 1.58]